jgi:hypothetical protein
MLHMLQLRLHVPENGHASNLLLCCKSDKVPGLLNCQSMESQTHLVISYPGYQVHCGNKE